MSAPTDCCSPCVTPVPTQIPGPEGTAGLNGTPGTNGGNAYTITTAPFVVPAQSSNVTVAVASTAWMQLGQVVFIPGAGNFVVATLFGANSVALTYAVDPDNINAGVPINAGAGVTPSGTNGTNGANGTNGFAHTTVNIIVPPLDSSVLAPVDSTAFMFVGQYVNVVGAGIFLVTGVPSSTSVTLKYPAFVGNTNSGATIVQPALVSQTNPGVVPSQAMYGAGAVYVLTATQANLALGGVNTAVTLPESGLWLILGRVRYDYAATTVPAGGPTITTKLRRTNNTAADVPNSSTAFLLTNLGPLTETLEHLSLPPVLYNTANNNDVIELFGALSTTVGFTNPPEAVETSIVAVWLHP
jgi:hypothetical protein